MSLAPLQHIKGKFLQWVQGMGRSIVPAVTDVANHLRLSVEETAFSAGFYDGQRWQYEQTRRLLCPQCAGNLTIEMHAGQPKHRINRNDPNDPTGIWLQPCGAITIRSLQP